MIKNNNIKVQKRKELKTNMNKNELVTAVAEKTNLTKKAVADVIKATTETIVETVAKDKDAKVSIAGFGSFDSKTIGARSGKLAFVGAEGKEWNSPEHQAPRFRAGKAFKDAVKAE